MINLRIITPTGTYLTQSVEYLEVRAPHSVLGILPGHAPLVSIINIAPLKTKVKKPKSKGSKADSVEKVTVAELLPELDNTQVVFFM